MLVDDAGDTVSGLYGLGPDAFPSAFRAKLWAVVQLLHLAMPPVTIRVHSQGVVGKGQDIVVRICLPICRPVGHVLAQGWP